MSSVGGALISSPFAGWIGKRGYIGSVVLQSRLSEVGSLYGMCGCESHGFFYK